LFDRRRIAYGDAVSTPATTQDLAELEVRLEAKLEAKLATKAELAEAVATLATKAELAEAVARLEAKMATKDDIARLERQIGEATMHVANVVLDGVRAQIAALDDKYRDLPARHETLRSAVEAHVADRGVHVSAPRPKRSRRPR
jgi:cell division protein FtsB